MAKTTLTHGPMPLPQALLLTAALALRHDEGIASSRPLPPSRAPGGLPGWMANLEVAREGLVEPMTAAIERSERPLRAAVAAMREMVDAQATPGEIDAEQALAFDEAHEAMLAAFYVSLVLPEARMRFDVRDDGHWRVRIGCPAAFSDLVLRRLEDGRDEAARFVTGFREALGVFGLADAMTGHDTGRSAESDGGDCTATGGLCEGRQDGRCGR